MKKNEKLVRTVEHHVYSDKVYVINGKKYSKEDFLSEVKRLSEIGEIGKDGAQTNIDIQNDNQISKLTESILLQNSNNNITVQNTKNNGKVTVETKPNAKTNVVINKTENLQTKQEWKRKNNKTRITQKQSLLEKEVWEKLAKTHYAGGVLGLRDFQEGDISANKIIAEVEERTGKSIIVDEVGSYQGLLDKVDELLLLDRDNPNSIDADEAKKLKSHIISNKADIEANSNGFIIGNTFFVINKKAAKERMEQEVDITGQKSFMQGAAWLHEIGHYLDNITKTVEEISQKGIYLNEFLLNDKDESSQMLNANVENRLRLMSDTNGDRRPTRKNRQNRCCFR